jgi:tRNA threonylcarbamoyladenosine biosynthesis protein TsaB
MLLLALDTAGPNCAVALARSRAGGPEILTRVEERIGRGHAEALMPMIEAALAASGVSFGDLQRIAVATGPGSFTGVRVGVAAARGLALALNIPAAGIGSLNAIAYPVVRSESEGTVAAVLDAKRGEVYAFLQDIESGAVVLEASALPAKGLAMRLRSAARPLILTGAGAPIVAALLDKPEPRIAGLAEAPDIADIAGLGLSAGIIAPPTPVYARSADAKPQLGRALARL